MNMVKYLVTFGTHGTYLEDFTADEAKKIQHMLDTVKFKANSNVKGYNPTDEDVIHDVAAIAINRFIYARDFYCFS